jgi:hypothetical protein
MPEAPDPLTHDERQDLQRLESVIRTGRAAIGEALREINKRQLWRATHRTFREYCAERWAMSYTHAYRLIAAVPIAENLGKKPGEVPERQLRELEGLEPEVQRKVYERASIGGEPTTNRIRECREALEAGILDGRPSVPLPPRHSNAVSRAEELVERLRRLADDVGIAEDAGPVLDRLTRLFRRAERREPAQASA